MIFSSCTTISLNGNNFQHPILMTSVILLGESLNLGIYSVIKRIRENRMEGTGGNTHFFTNGDVLQYKHTTIFAIGILDSISSIILITALGFTYPTVFILTCRKYFFLLIYSLYQCKSTS